jgi:hypothetical protein
MSPSVPQIASSIAYYLIFGRPLLLYLGLMTLVTFSVVASIPLLNRRGIRWLPFRWHRPAAFTGLTLGAVHGLLAFLSNL